MHRAVKVRTTNALSIMVPAWARLMIFITPYTRASPYDIRAYRRPSRPR